MLRVPLLALAVLAAAHAASVGSPEESAQCEQASCSLNHLHHYYLELDCKPVKEKGQCCPSRYDCSHMATRDKSKCYFKGQELDTKAVRGEVVPGSCLAGCFCRQTKEAGAVATLTCAHIECPSLFNPSLIPEGCVATYSRDTCCSDGVLCQQNVTAETVKCEWKGKTYLEGQKFYPDEEPCKTCVCQKGFDGTLNGPWCKKVTCGIELHYAGHLSKGCAPVFLEEKVCCPIEWRCPDQDDVVVAAAASKNPEEPADPEATCQWGALTLKKGESLSLSKASSGSGPCQRCRCDLPPHVTCETNGQPCQDKDAPVAVAPAEVEQPGEAVISAAPPVTTNSQEPKSRPARAYTCANVRCVSRCVMMEGRPKCVGPPSPTS